MTEPPILTGDEAKLNRVMRELTGRFTEKDDELWHWIMFEYYRVTPIHALPIPSRHGSMKDQILIYDGKQIWPPE